MPHQLLFLLRHWQRTGEESALRMADGTLAAMRRGGIYDQLGFGFHRYSTDRQWLVPHFEKMLYDQALLVLAFTGGVPGDRQRGARPDAREILDYCLRDLLAPEGGFFTAEDADSEGEEGRFYLWSMEEIRRILDPEEVPLAAAAYGLAEEGNFVDPVEPERRGRNILHLSASPKEIARGLGMTEKAFRKRLEAVRLRLLAVPGKAGPPAAGRQDPHRLERPDDRGPRPGRPRPRRAPVPGGGTDGDRVHPYAPEDGRRQAPPPLLQGGGGDDG